MSNINNKYRSFLKGFAAPFVSRAKVSNLIKLQNDNYEDYNAIQSDWQQVGSYMKNAIEVCCGETKN